MSAVQKKAPPKPFAGRQLIGKDGKRVKVWRSSDRRTSSSTPTPAPQGTPPLATAQKQKQQPQPPKARPYDCPNTECEESNVVNEDGNWICATCGTLVSDENITQDVQFNETSNGAAVVQGQWVGAGEETARGAPGSNRLLNDVSSRQQTLNLGRDAIRRIGGHFNLTADDRARAERIYGLALGQDLTKGREREHVAAVCAYAGLRLGSTQSQLLLIDFADKVNVNVFYLGRIYTEFCKRLNLKLDRRTGIQELLPERLIERFCQDLDFGNDTFKIANEAAQILKRMKRDWIVTGRRPSGLCGAAIILAARMNNYRRTVREVVYTAKVCELTITKRLEEFKYTPASKMTVKDFQKVKNWDEVDDAECDPPSYYQQFVKKKPRKRVRAVVDCTNDGDAGTIASGSIPSDSRANSISPAEDNHEPERIAESAMARNQANADKQAMPPPPVPIDPALLQVSAGALADLGEADASNATVRGKKRKAPGSIDEADGADEDSLDDARRKRPRKTLPEPTPEAVADEEALELDMSTALEDEEMLSHVNEAHEAAAREPAPIMPDESQEQALSPSYRSAAEEENDEGDAAAEPEFSDDELESEPRDPHEAARQKAFEENNPFRDRADFFDESGNYIGKKYPIMTADLLAKLPDSQIIPESEFADDVEVADCILTEDERLVKERIWLTKYGKHLRDRHLAKIGRLLEQENGTGKERKTRAGRKKPRMGDTTAMPKFGSVQEATEWMMERRGFSKKIDYDKMKDAFAPDGATTREEGTPAPTTTPGTFTYTGLMKGPKTRVRKSRKKEKTSAPAAAGDGTEAESEAGSRAGTEVGSVPPEDSARRNLRVIQEAEERAKTRSKEGSQAAEEQEGLQEEQGGRAEYDQDYLNRLAAGLEEDYGDEDYDGYGGGEDEEPEGEID